MYLLKRTFGTLAVLALWMLPTSGCDLGVNPDQQDAGLDEQVKITANKHHAGRSPRAAANCRNVRGTMTGNVFTFSTMTGSLDGYIVTAAGQPETEPRGNGVLALKTWHKIALDDENFILTNDEGVMAPVNPPEYRLNNRYTINGGAGIYENASGFIHVNGTLIVDPEDLELENNGFIDVTYNGRVCK